MPAKFRLPERRVAVNSEPWVWQNTLLTTLAVVTAAITAVPAFANPVLAVSRTSALAQTVPNLLTTTLGGQDLFFGAPGQGPNYNYPNPTLQRSRTAALVSQTNVTGTLNITTLFVEPEKFFRYDLSNPVLPRSKTAALTAQPSPNLATTTLKAPDVFIGLGGSYTWANPRTPIARVTQFGSWQNLLPVTTTAPVCYEASASLMRNTPVPGEGAMTNGPAAAEGAMANQVPMAGIMGNGPVPSQGAMGNAVVAAEGELC